MQADEAQILAGRPRVLGRTQQLGPDQHRVEAADEEEGTDAEEVLDADHLVVGREAEVAANPTAALLVPADGPARRHVRAVLVDVPAGRPAEQPCERVVEEAHPGEPADRADEKSHEHRDVVLVGSEQIVLADCDLPADPVADEEADDPEDNRRQEVEADQATKHVPS